jgi:hypothetical protein
MKELQQYTYTVPANGSVQIPATNDNFYVQASTGPVAVRGNTFGRMRAMVAGMGLRNVPFDRLELFDESGAPNTVTLLMTPAEFVNNTFSGSVTVVGGNLTDAQLRASRVMVSEAEPSTGNLVTALIFALGLNTIIAPAANVNGLILQKANEWVYAAAGTPALYMLSKATNPVNAADGEGVAVGIGIGYSTGGGQYIDLQQPVRIPAGHGVFVWCNNTAPTLRAAAYRWIAL